MKKIIILITMICSFWGKGLAQLLNAGDAVVTFNDQIYTFSGAPTPTNLVMQIFRTSNTAAALPNLGAVANPALNWSTFKYSDSRWTSSNLGLIFGVTIDNSKNIFVSATRFFGPQPAGKSTGAIYKIDGVSGTPTLFKDLNIGGSVNDTALGNIKFFNGNLYVSNLKDGRIYCINATTATTVDIYTPTGWTIGDRPCGLAIRNIGGSPRLFFSRNGFNALTTGIYSIGLNASGSFTGIQNNEIPIASSLPNNNDAITDIAFSKDGNQMILAQKTYSLFYPSYKWNYPSALGIAHNSTIVKYKQISGIWVNSNANFFIGNYGLHTNATGGLDFSDFQINTDKVVFCDTTIYATSDAIFLSGTPAPTSSWYACYGATGFNNQINAGSNSGLNIDFNNDGGQLYKGHYGDIEIVDTTLECPKPCQCSQTLKPYLYWLNDNKQDSLQLNCGDTKTNVLDCFNFYMIKVKNPCGDKCEPDEVITTITYPNGTVSASTSTTGVPMYVGTATGNYIVSIKVKCNGVWCNECKLIFKQTKSCQPACDNCKDKVQATFNSGASSVVVAAHPAATSLNASFFLDGGTDTYTEVRANIVDVQIISGKYDSNNNFVPGSAACLQCYNNANSWGSIVSGSLPIFSSAITSYTGVGATNPNNNPREVVFTTTTPTALPFGTALNLTMQIPGISTISCCCITVKVFVKITYRNNKCEECSKVVLIDLTQCPSGNPTGNGGVGTAVFNQTGHPQYKIAAPTRGTVGAVNFDNNLKNNK